MEEIIPKRVTIETIFGCNASCKMCVINKPTHRKKGQMKQELFCRIIDSLAPYVKQIAMMDLFGLGEPLLDKMIFERIKYVKQKGFGNVGFSTNADLLDNVKQGKLLDSGLDTVLFSVDGVKKETHENIRRGVNFDRVVKNIQSIIKKRNRNNYETRFVVRFILQPSNRNEWEPFRAFWEERISPERNDFITFHDVHTWGGEMAAHKSKLKTLKATEMQIGPCELISEVLYILSDGTVPLCNKDWLNANYNMGNVIQSLPIEIFNTPQFNEIRGIHAEGFRNKFDICRECDTGYG